MTKLGILLPFYVHVSSILDKKSSNCFNFYVDMENSFHKTYVSQIKQIPTKIYEIIK